MVTASNLKEVITTEEANLLAMDSGTLDTSILDAAIDAAYDHVLPYVRQAIPNAQREDVPAELDSKVLTLAKWFLFQRNGLYNEVLDRERTFIENFLLRVARGEIPIIATTTDTDVNGDSGYEDTGDLFGSKIFKL